MPQQSDHATYRVLVFGGDGAEILLTRSHSAAHFPEVTIPQWQRVAENVASALKQLWGVQVVCLFEPNSSHVASTSRYIAARHWSACGTPPAHLQWISVRELSANLFADPNDYRAMHESLAKCRASTSDASIAIFARLSWFEELCAWIGHAIASRGLHLTGGFRQLNASSTFSLVRFETNGPAVWFKAVGKPKEREFPIAQALAQTIPSHVPELLATNSLWNGWLTSEFSGIELGETRDIEIWKLAAKALGTLQIESLGKVTQFRAAGAHDLSPTVLSTMVDPLLEIIGELMAKQLKVPPPVLTRKELASLGRCITAALEFIDRHRIPDALGHLDPNPGNIVISPNRCVFLDWAEAYVGHPFYSFEYLLEHFRCTFGDGEQVKRELIKSYAVQWREIASSSVVDEALVVTPLLAVFAYAAGSGLAWDSESLQQPSSAGYLRGLARRMNREANQILERRPQCCA
jgi:Phosphotransferase enzyme family